ncbi:MAG: TadE family protein [Pseudomonadota bacterium]
MYNRCLTWLRTQTRNLVQDRRGVSAVEFSLLAPFLVMGAISTVDAGMAVYDKMMITQVLRSGAHSAISAESEAQMLAILEATAQDNFTLAQGTPSQGELGLSVNSYCVCPEATGTAVACTTTCSGGVSPNEFYELSAVMEFDSVLLPNFTLDSSLDVIAP